MKTTVTTETDLVTGQQTFEFEMNPVPINTPIGLAPGQVRVMASKSGSLVGVELVLRPTLVAFRGAIDRLAKQADWPVPVDQLRLLGPNEQPVVHLKLAPEAVAQVLDPLREPTDLNAVLNHASVQDPLSYRVETITAET